LLKRLCEIVEDASTIIFRVRGVKEPVEFLAGDDVSGLVMPMHVAEEKIESDRWHPTKKEILKGLKGDGREWKLKQ